MHLRLTPGLRMLAFVFFLLFVFGWLRGLRIMSAVVWVACFTAANVAAYRRRYRA